MELLDAIKARHPVRKYTDKPIEMAGPKGKDAEEKIGYYGDELYILKSGAEIARWKKE